MPLEPHPTDPDKMVYKSRQYQLDCPTCEYHKQRAQIWRDEAYKLSGHPLPERDPVLEEREACAKIADEWAVGWPHPSQTIAEWIRKRGKA
jgi:hypothetical protein